MAATANHTCIRKASEAQQLREELDQSRREYELFAGRVSHDLHAVLQHIDGFIAELQQHCGSSLDPSGSYLVDRARDNAAHGIKLIDALHRYDQVGSARLASAALDPVRLLERAKREVERSAPLPALDLQASGIFPPVAGDPRLLEQALANLLSNAVQFRKEDTPLVVRITGSVQDGMLELAVADNGIGFNPAEIHRLFQPLTRLHPGHAREGIGMGLACTRRIAERHGGHVGAEAAPDGGAVFTILLPLHPGAGSAAGALQTPADSLQAAAGRKRVLLIDDDPLVLASVRTMLERCGYEVTAASGGLKGLQAFEHALRSLAYDVVVTDWGMPHVGGERVAVAVKTISPGTPVVVITGRELVAQQAGGTAVDIVLPKPLRMNGLRAALEVVAGGSGASAAAGGGAQRR